MDRFTWAIVGGVVALCVAALASVVMLRASQPPPDLSTPAGVATAYILAIQNRDPDAAWELLASPDAAFPRLRRPPGEGPLTRERFRQEVLNLYRQENKRLRVVATIPGADVARVEVEIAWVRSGPPLLGSAPPPRTMLFELKRQGATWRITSAPPLWDLA